MNIHMVEFSDCDRCARQIKRDTRSNNTMVIEDGKPQDELRLEACLCGKGDVTSTSLKRESMKASLSADEAVSERYREELRLGKESRLGDTYRPPTEESSILEMLKRIKPRGNYVRHLVLTQAHGHSGSDWEEITYLSRKTVLEVQLCVYLETHQYLALQHWSNDANVGDLKSQSDSSS